MAHQSGRGVFWVLAALCVVLLTDLAGRTEEPDAHKWQVAPGEVLPASNTDYAKNAVERDIYQTMWARRMLLEDPVLAPFNLGVRVRNRIATLWGPVPNHELGLAAQRRLNSMIELVDVRNELYVELPDPRRDPPGYVPRAKIPPSPNHSTGPGFPGSISISPNIDSKRTQPTPTASQPAN